MFRTSVHKFVPYTVLPIAIFSVQLYTPMPIGNTMVWWLVQIVVLFIFFWEAYFNIISIEQKRLILIIKLYLAWNIISIARGVFAAENYWHYKSLVGMGMILLMPVVVYIALNKQLVQDILAFFIKIVLPFSIFIFPFLGIGAWGWYLYPIVLLALFFPAVPFKWKFLILLISLVVIFGDMGTRSHVIKFSVPYLLLFGFYYTRHVLSVVKLMQIGRWILLILPFILLLLAVLGIFNIFKMDEYIEGDYVEQRKNQDGQVVEEDLTVDTRTFIYEEVINSSIKYNYWILGRTPARGNEAVWFAKEMIETYGEPERPRNEVGILNVFTWTGIVGVVLYFIIFLRASFLAINRSRNIYAKLIGFFVAFRWFYTWIEDYQVFDTNNFTLWLLIGLSFSTSFRAMTDIEVKVWVWGIFKREYYLVYNYYLNKKKMHIV